MEKKQIKKLYDSLTLEQKIGQLVQCPGIAFDKEGVLTGIAYLSWITPDLLKNCGSTLNVFNNEKLRKIQKKHLENNPIPLMFMADIINGYELVFPSSIAQGCSFNPVLTERAAEITAYEASKHGISVTFSPMVDVSRDARWGRISEGYGESTLLNSDFGAANVKGYQGESLASDDTIASCVKHFAAYGATEDGRDYYGLEMSERKLRSTYLPPFKAAVDAGASLIMPAFNTINGVPCTTNKFLLNDVLRDEWGFDGVVISDYSALYGVIAEGAAESKVECAETAMQAGVDISMVDDIYVTGLKEGIESGRISEDLLEKAVMRILNLKNDLGILDNPYKYIDVDSENIKLESSKHKEFAVDMVCQSSVLLKNDKMLPLSKNEKTAFIGPFADINELMTNWSRITPHRDKGISIKQALDNKFGSERFACVKGCTFAPEECRMNDMKNDVVIGHEKEYLLDALNKAEKADNVVLVLGEHRELFGEAHSRSDISIPKTQMDMFNEIYKINQNITVVIFAGRPLDIKEINEKAKAVLYVWYPGTYGAEAIVDMLFGDRVPSGKLAMTIPQSIGQLPIHHEKLPTNHYSEVGGIDGNYGCRYVDITNLPLYPFGHGLSYTEFEYSDITIDKNKITVNDKITATVSVTNKGNIDAYETVQMYLHDVSAKNVSLPLKVLKGYQKLFIKAGETKEVKFIIDNEMLKYYNINNKFVSEKGEFEVYIGKDSMTKNSAVFELI